MDFSKFAFKRIYLLYLLNFLAAFLLFQIELIISKIFLPKFGGSYLIWGACVVFFQSILLLGYLYSHVVVQKAWVFKYKYLRLALVVLPLLFFPGRPLMAIMAHSHLPIVIDIFLQLFVSIGIVFFALSTVSIITQSWFSASDLSGHANPFILYGVSNLGSFIALFSYPFIFEPFFDLNQQLAIWRWGYLLFLVFYFVAFRLIKINRAQGSGSGLNLNIAWIFKRFEYSAALQEGVYWFLLSAVGSIMFLSVTNIITYEITPCPLLWILPLCVYLLSFVLNFKEKPYAPAWIEKKIYLAIGFTILLYFFTLMRVFPRLIEIAAYCFSLFILCMYCQRELFVTKPKDHGRLTAFYLIIAFGGVAGSVLVTWIAPLIFTNTLEFIFGLFAMSLAMAMKEKKPKVGLFYLRFILCAVLTLVFWPLFFKQYNFFGIILIIVMFNLIFSRLKTARMLNLCLACILILAAFTSEYWVRGGSDFYVYRNYYGIYRMSAEEHMFVLSNGTTVHGEQFIDKKKKKEPLSYYHRETPVGKLLDSDIIQRKNIGIIGLGAGTLAAYGKEGDQIDFFELDRDIFDIANTFFTYLKDSSAKINYFFGDARIALEKISENKYDLLIIDAFSGDSVPVHLLTVEAIEEYRKHIKPGGTILFHISNRYFNITPVLFNNAKVVNAHAVFNSNKRSNNSAYLASTWVILTWDARAKDSLMQKLGWKEEGDKLKIKKIRPWTDAYSNLLAVIVVKNFIYPIKSFTPFSW